MNDFRIYQQFAESIARQAGKMIKISCVEHHDIQFKSKYDFVTDVDERSQKIIQTAINKEYPEHQFFGEESADANDVDLDKTAKDFIWIVDPIDGTTNFIRQMPFFSVSIAMAYKHELVVGVVYNPMTDEMFSASKGTGAFVNGRVVHVSDVDNLDSTIVSLSMPAAAIEQRPYVCSCIEGASKSCLSIRILNSAAICMAHVAAGRMEAHYEEGIHIWDLAAGAVLIKEAGGEISDAKGNPITLNTTSVFASNKKIRPFVSTIFC